LTENKNNNSEVTDDGDIEKIAYRFEDSGEAIAVLGVGDRFLRIIQESADATVVARGSKVIIHGSPDEVSRLENIFDRLRGVVAEGREVNAEDVRLMMSQGFAAEYKEHPKEEGLSLDTHQVRIRPRTKGQEKYLRSILEYPMTFCTGPAGSGKTYLAVAVAAHFLKLRRAQRVILTRPAVEAGESLGFLPGDLYEKVAPYFRPLYDALYEMLGVERTRKMIEDEVIEIAPLAYMRGRTLNKSFIILDEGQNTTIKQMKMFLTRLGPESRAVITGDVTQIDLPPDQESGLIQACRLLKGIPGIGFTELTEKDIVRHHLVQRIVRAYEQEENRNRENAKNNNPKPD
jgi:phosphate starvation-inducible PhoH-like protein